MDAKNTRARRLAVVIAILAVMAAAAFAACWMIKNRKQGDGAGDGKTQGISTDRLYPKSMEHLSELTEEEIEGSKTKDGGYCIYNVKTDKTSIAVPEEVKGFPVTEIEDYTFAGGNYEYIAIPDTVKRIGAAAFSECPDLIDVSLGEGLELIGHNAFFGCPSLISVTIPEGTAIMDGQVFGECSMLDNIYIPASVADFGDGTRILDVNTCLNAVVVTPEGSMAEAVCKEEKIPYRSN